MWDLRYPTRYTALDNLLDDNLKQARIESWIAKYKTRRKEISAGYMKRHEQA